MTDLLRGGAPGEFSSSERREMLDFWEVYDAHYEQVGAELMDSLAGDPEFAPLFLNISSEERVEQRRESRELLRRAFVEGDWGPYLDNLHAQGAGYSAAGLSFGAWFKAVGAFRPYLTPHMVSAYGDDMDRMLSAFRGMDRFIDTAMAVIGEAYLQSKEGIISEQQSALRELSTPVLQIREGRLILPVVGLLDSRRARQLTGQLLDSIRAHRARAVVVDITGVPAVDSEVANHLLHTVDACRLMGAEVIVTGLSTEIAQTLVSLGLDLSRMRTAGDLQSGVEEIDRMMGDRLVREDEWKALSTNHEGDA